MDSLSLGLEIIQLKYGKKLTNNNENILILFINNLKLIMNLN